MELAQKCPDNYIEHPVVKDKEKVRAYYERGPGTVSDSVLCALIKTAAVSDDHEPPS